MISTNIPEEILELERQLPNDFESYKDSLPKEPTDPDVKKEYSVGCYSADDWHFVHEILMQDGTLEDNIPNHSCECINDCLHSATRGIYLLTDSEAEELRNSPRVEYVNINVGKYPGTYLIDPKDLIAAAEVQKQRYSSPISNQRSFPSTLLSPDTNAVTTTYPEMCRRFIVGIEANSLNSGWRTRVSYSADSVHRGGSISSTTDNPSFEIEAGDHFIFVNYDSNNHPLVIQTTSGIGGNTSGIEVNSGSSNPQVVRWYTETPGTYYYQCQNHSSMVGTITVSARDTVDTSLKNRAGYQLLRHKEQQNPWLLSSLGVITDNIFQRGDGTDVDVIVADTLAWFGHIEFQNNLGGPNGYVGGNVLPGNGTCDLLDLVLDAPYYLDPDFFNANPSKLTTRWDGTTVPTDFAARNWWQNNSTSHRSAKFVSPANGGTATGDNDFGVVGSINSSYLRERFGTNTERNYSDQHGTSCASQAYGRQYGWAYNANKWYMNLYGTFSCGFEIGFDIQKIFHKIKPINSKYGTRNPTISSNSWGMPNIPPTTGYYYYRSGDTGSNGVAFNVTSWYSGGTPEFITNHSFTSIESEMVPSSLLTAGNELVDAGVICVCAAGNENQKLVKADHPDYNNYYSLSDNTALTNATYTYNGNTYYRTINRAGMPLQIGASGSGTSKVYKTICVGALDDSYSFSANNIESKVYYSNRGNLIDIFMAGDGTTAAGAPTFGTSGDYYRYIRPDQYYTINGVQSRPSFDVRFSGTSSAAPTFAGLLATKLQYQRDWTYAEVKTWISSLGEIDPNDFYYGTESTTVDDVNWSDDYSLQGAPAIVGWDKSTRYYDPLRISGNIDLHSNVQPDFEITDLAASVDEGQSISPTIGVTSKWNNLLVDTNRVYWDISGVSIASTDFSSVGADGNPDVGTFLSGYIDVNATATSKQFPIGVRSDNYTDDPSGANIGAGETATLSIYRDFSRTQLLDSSNFIINDTSTGSNFEFLLVGGGGAGGTVVGQNHQGGGGGGAGGVRVVSDPDIFNNNSTIWIGIGTGGIPTFPHQYGNTTYLRDTNSTGTEIYSVGGGGRGGPDYTAGGNAPAGGGSGGGAGNGGSSSSPLSGGSGSTYGNNGGTSRSYCNTSGGGGAGGAGQDNSFGGGDGGIGYDLTNFFSELAGDGYNGGDRIAGGGGGGRTEYYWEGGASCAGSSTHGSGRDGGGDGRLSNTQPDINATPNTGGGGGGGDGGPNSNYPSGSVFSNTVRYGGNGGSGIVYLKYTSETQLVGNWTGISTHHTATSYDQSVAGGTKRTWIHKIIGDGALSLL